MSTEPNGWMIRVRRRRMATVRRTEDEYRLQFFAPAPEGVERSGRGGLNLSPDELLSLRSLLSDVEWQDMEIIEREEALAKKRGEIAALEMELAALGAEGV